MRRAAPFFQTSLAALFFLAATILFTWPIAPHMADGLADLWDAKLNAWILHWDFHQIFRDPLHLFDANIFYPARYALAFSENLFGAALFGFPLYVLGLSTLAVYNAVFLLGMFLSAMAAWALAREVTGDPLASVVAGLVYAFCPWRIAQIPHIQFQWGAFLALALLFLLRALDGGGRRNAVFFGICLAWNALCNVHYALFSGFLFALVLVYEGLVAGWAAFRPRLLAVLAAMALAGIVVLPFLIPYALASRLYGMRRGYEEISFFSGVWTDFLTAGGQNKLYAPLTQKWAKAEGELFPGIAALVLAGVALARRRREERRPESRQAPPRKRRVAALFDVLLLGAVALWIAALAGHTSVGPLKLREPGRIAVVLTILLAARLAAAFPGRSRFADLADFLRRMRLGTRAGLFLAITVLGVLVALGTHTPYYRFLVQSFGPIFRVIRAPSRGVVLFDLGLGVLAAWGLADLLRGRRLSTHTLATAAVTLAVGLEYRAFPVAVRPIDPKPPEAERWLSAVSFPCVVVGWPLGTWYDQEHEFRSTAHWKPILNGASGFAPASYDELAATLAQKPIPDRVWDMLAERGATLLLFHPDRVEGEAQKAYAEAILRGVNGRKIEPLRSFPHGEDRDVLFGIASAPQAAFASDPDAPETRQTVLRLERLSHPPFGYIDVPRNGETAAPGSRGFGWALDDSGVARVVVSFDDMPGTDAVVGQPHPGPAGAYPGFPDSDHAGFGFAIPSLSSGFHVLKATVLARDGGRMEMQVGIRVP